MTRGGRVAAGVVVALGSVGGLTAVATIALSSAAGQRVDETALRGALIGRGQLIDGALTVLGLVSVVGLIVATCAVAVIAFSRRRVDLAVAAIAMIGGANVTTQVLKNGVLDRPDLGIDTLTLNSLPSGHSTVAASLAVALVLVVPDRLRGALALFGAAATALTGVATLAAGWHRPSDVAAALLVVGTWLGLSTAGLALVSGNDGPTPDAAGRAWPSAATVVLLGLGVIAIGVAAIMLWQTLGLDSITRDRFDLLLAYGGGAAGIGGLAAILFAVALLAAPGDDRPDHPSPTRVSAPGAAPPW